MRARLDGPCKDILLGHLKRNQNVVCLRCHVTGTKIRATFWQLVQPQLGAENLTQTTAPSCGSVLLTTQTLLNES